VPAYADPLPALDIHNPGWDFLPPRPLAYAGAAPATRAACLPGAALMTRADWEDLAGMDVPFVLARAVVADRGAARRSGEGEGEGVPFARVVRAAQEKEAAWWSPVRETLLLNMGLSADVDAGDAGRKPVVVYVSARAHGADAEQDTRGDRWAVRPEDERALVERLRREGAWDVRVVDVGEQTAWRARMDAVVRASVRVVIQRHLAHRLTIVLFFS
jgi:hypothetical protein